MAEPGPEITPHTDTAEPNAELNTAILNAVRGIRFGSVEIVIHDGKVVQIESKERIRFVPRGDRSKH